ncbi:uncharacterized protein LOC143518944 [Brachyhypopomus gauderio]|uniref:uncharacterized protein LOC143518944 n=1 Tax=Brachyhypopomus gauderio TaxID=698409 RepID=UPI004042935D
MSPVYSSPKYSTGSTLLSPFRPYEPYDPTLSYISRGQPQPSRYSLSTSRYMNPAPCLARLAVSVPQEPERGRLVPRGDPRPGRRSESSSRTQVRGQATWMSGARGRSPSHVGLPTTLPLPGWRRTVSQSDLAQELAALDVCEHGEGERGGGGCSGRESLVRAHGGCSWPFYWSSEVRLA